VLLTLVGGIGIFLVGMALLTEGLKTAAGSALREVLQRFTGNRFSAVASGAAITALVQSSSATTLATIGFVSAGLLSFQAAVGVIFGANLGTTSTGWLVSTIGLKVSVAEWTLPLIGAGALLWLLARGRRGAAGQALAGFGLIFVGIGTLQDGMGGLAERIDPGSFAGGGLGARFLLVGIGVAMTVVMQSSSAAIATTLAAVDSGAISLEEAAALAIGQNLGTTVTAGIAAIGATTAAKRTALAHVLFNAVTGAVALAALPAFVEAAEDTTGESDPAMALAAFHTLFNLAGVLLLLPVLGTFARTVARLVPERGPHYLANLDDAVATVPDLAIDAARRAAAAIGEALLRASVDLTRGATPRATAEAAGAIEPLTRFIERVDPGSDPAARQAYASLLHAMDHLHRLAGLVSERRPPLAPAAVFPRRSALLAERLEALAAALGDAEQLRAALAETGEAARRFAYWRETRRRRLIEEAAARGSQGMVESVAQDVRAWRRRLFGDSSSGAASRPQARPQPGLVERLDTMLWMARVIYHGWRLAAHLDAIASGQRAEAAPPEPG